MSSHNPLDHAKWPALIGLALGTVLLSRQLPTSFAFDRVFHSAIATLACSGGAVIALSKWIPREEGAFRSAKYPDTLPLGEVGRPHASRDGSPVRGEEVSPGLSLRTLRLLFVLLVAVLCVRVEVLRQVIRHVQCTSFSWAPLVPFVFALLDYWNSSPEKKTFGPGGLTSYLRLGDLTLLYVPYYALQLGYGGMLALENTAGPRSTVVCAALLPYRWLIPLLQFLGSALDIAIVYCISRLLLNDARGSRSLPLRIASIGYAFMLSAATLIIIGVIYFLVEAGHRHWILTIPKLYNWSVLRLDLLVAFTLLCALPCLFNFGVTTTSIITTFTSIMTLTTTSALDLVPPFPSQHLGSAFLGIFILMLAFLAYTHTKFFAPASGQGGARIKSKIVHLLFYLTLSVLFLLWAGIWTSHSAVTTYHPIDRLTSEAQSHHTSYAQQAIVSKSLAQAVQEYQRRYRKRPPPNFDHWYKFATERESVIIDEFDSINRDLQPFFALSPQQIRDRTWELVSNPWNDVAGLVIRNGTVSVAPNVVPTHRWMIDGVAQIASKFSQWLPDMDLAFNLNDEPRVVVPYEDVVRMKQAEELHILHTDRASPYRSFSPNRGMQWPVVPEEPNTHTPLHELSWQKIFHRYGALACPSDSPARTQRIWDTGHLCPGCTRPQSMGAFLSNWTTAADICHQPDLAELHGLYLAPAAFKGTHELYPIFSQSKAQGFNDILYPSAWNYLENAKYDPTEEHPDKSFSEKQDLLFWRGATSEGVSIGWGMWKGMTRQRLVHMANNINNTSPPQPLLLPTRGSEKLEYKNIASSKLTEFLPTDVHIVDVIVRCASHDCDKQDREFQPLVPPSDFQTHWQYKYLLDMDGAGFSGRFIPFLRSRSLPFKTALFREWWDDRVTPWYHFVPLDLRGQGFWATYAYFRGIKGDLGRGIGKVEVEGHAKAAEDIAMQGRQWANQALRREDMEIYLFRLLLEWGRLTDDRRDECGYTGK